MRKAILTFAALLGMALQASAAPPPTITNAADGIFTAFHTHPLVGLGEVHDWAQELDFYGTLLRDSRFAREVGNIVLEVGDAAQQETADRYVSGENVPYTELRKVWSDTVGWFPTVTAVGSINLYTIIRDVNMKLPPENRIKVWLGDPPIDWSQIKTKADWDPLEAQRDSYPAGLIVREILSKNKKALVIYGTAHFDNFPGRENIRTLLDRARPGAFFVVSPFVGYANKSCEAQLAKFSTQLPVPSLLTPIRGSSLEEDIYRPGCDAGVNGEALLYLGPRNQMMRGPRSSDVYLDSDYHAELERRFKLRTGKTISLTPANYPTTPQPFWKN